MNIVKSYRHLNLLMLDLSDSKIENLAYIPILL